MIKETNEFWKYSNYDEQTGAKSGDFAQGVNSYCQKLKRAGNGGSLHNSHLHSGNFNSSIVKIIIEK